MYEPTYGEHEHSRPVLRDSAVPPGTNVLRTDRASRAMRERYADHLADLHAREYLKDGEFSAREDAALEAVTLDQLRILLADLPALPSPPSRKDRWENKRFYVPVLIGGVIASILVAVSPFFILSLLGLQQDSALMTPLGVASVLVGVVGFLSCMVTLAMKLEDD